MDPFADLPPLNIPSLLRNHQLAPRKSLGQNFLTDPVALGRIVEAAEIPSSANVLEVGPGLGSLTRYLARVARRVKAVELDSTLLPLLDFVLAGAPNVTVYHGDILEIDLDELMGDEPYLVVANIPYYITSAVIRRLLEARNRPLRLTLTVQREVAERVCARPGDMSILAASVQVYGKPSIAARIPAGAFYPPPKVDSAVIRVDLYPEPLVPAAELDKFFRVVKAGFGQKRKTLRNSLSSGLKLPTAVIEERLAAAGIDPQRRAETLSMEEWQRLSGTLRPAE